MEENDKQDKNNNNNNNTFKQPDCMCRMCRTRRGGRPPLITSSHAHPGPTLNLTDDEFRKIRSAWKSYEAWQSYVNENYSHTLPQNHLLSQDLNDLKKTLVKYTNDNKINLSTKQVEIFISKFFEEFNKKYIITLRSKL
jgi:hypothetical protein